MNKRMICFLVASVCLSGACRERDIEVYDANRVSLNIAKGEFRPGTYPESYEFNAYFLGVGAGDYTLDIPVRLTGAVDYDRDREYRVRVNEELSQYAVNGVEYTLDEKQLLRKGLYEDTFPLTIHVARLNETDDYKLRIELAPNENFEAGLPEYQWVEEMRQIFGGQRHYRSRLEGCRNQSRSGLLDRRLHGIFRAERSLRPGDG